MLKKEFGAAGDEVVIEEFLEGEELSFFTFSDGLTLRTLPPAQVCVLEVLLPFSCCFSSLEISLRPRNMHYSSTGTGDWKY